MVKQFIECLLNVLDRNIKKRNCLEIVSPPSAGKNYFFHCVTSFYLNVGFIGNYNKTERFPFHDCVNRRVNVWNEPNCETSCYDTINMLFGGDAFSVKIKHQGDQILPRTPVIVLSNNKVFPRDLAFTDRMFRFTWKRCEFLKEYLKFLHPLVWPVVIDWGKELKGL